MARGEIVSIQQLEHGIDVVVHSVAKYMTGQSGLLSFLPKGTKEDAQTFVGRLHFFQNGVSWGGFESLALFLHYDEPLENLVRLHIGLENPDTLIADLDQALNRIGK